MKAAIEPPPPGVSPSNRPKMQPMVCERLSLFIIARLGRRMRIELPELRRRSGAPDCAHQLAEREQADHDQHRLDAAEQIGDAEGEAVDAGDRIGADGGDHQPDDRRGEALAAASRRSSRR